MAPKTLKTPQRTTEESKDPSPSSSNTDFEEKLNQNRQSRQTRATMAALNNARLALERKDPPYVQGLTDTGSNLGTSEDDQYEGHRKAPAIVSRTKTRCSNPSATAKRRGSQTDGPNKRQALSPKSPLSKDSLDKGLFQVYLRLAFMDVTASAKFTGFPVKEGHYATAFPTILTSKKADFELFESEIKRHLKDWREDDTGFTYELNEFDKSKFFFNPTHSHQLEDDNGKIRLCHPWKNKTHYRHWHPICGPKQLQEAYMYGDIVDSLLLEASDDQDPTVASADDASHCIDGDAHGKCLLLTVLTVVKKKEPKKTDVTEVQFDLLPPAVKDGEEYVVKDKVKDVVCTVRMPYSESMRLGIVVYKLVEELKIQQPKEYYTPLSEGQLESERLTVGEKSGFFIAKDGRRSAKLAAATSSESLNRYLDQQKCKQTALIEASDKRTKCVIARVALGQRLENDAPYNRSAPDLNFSQSPSNSPLALKAGKGKGKEGRMIRTSSHAEQRQIILDLSENQSSPYYKAFSPGVKMLLGMKLKSDEFRKSILAELDVANGKYPSPELLFEKEDEWRSVEGWPPEKGKYATSALAPPADDAKEEKMTLAASIYHLGDYMKASFAMPMR